VKGSIGNHHERGALELERKAGGHSPFNMPLLEEGKRGEVHHK